VRLVVAPAGVERAMTLLGVQRERLLALSNGVDLELFRPQALDRGAFWQRALVQQPRGWLPDQPAGSARYSEAAITGLASGTVLLNVGRFTAVKRLDLLIGAFARAQALTASPAGLVLVGGHPGEWENEHPALIAARLGTANVYLAGWQSQRELPAFFAAADAVVTSSEREQFGQALIEGMACGLPAIATRSLGPAAIIEHGDTGWLTAPGDETALATALTEAIDDAPERRRRGERARLSVRERFSWSGIAAQLMTVLETVAGNTRHAPPVEG
jgi:glycosyltransferase involved in cell wall biosynthesis